MKDAMSHEVFEEILKLLMMFGLSLSLRNTLANLIPHDLYLIFQKCQSSKVYKYNYNYM